MYPAAGEEALDLLYKILVLNPYFRISVDECLNHPFFASMRKPESEKGAEAAIFFDWEKEHLDSEKLRALFLEEINHFRK